MVTVDDQWIHFALFCIILHYFAFYKNITSPCLFACFSKVHQMNIISTAEVTNLSGISCIVAGIRTSVKTWENKRQITREQQGDDLNVYRRLLSFLLRDVNETFFFHFIVINLPNWYWILKSAQVNFYILYWNRHNKLKVDILRCSYVQTYKYCYSKGLSC